MSAFTVVLLIVGVPLAVAAGLVADPEDRACGVSTWYRPRCVGPPAGLWVRFVRLAFRRGRRLRTAVALLGVLLCALSGGLRAIAVAARLADLGAAHLAERADEFAGDPMFDPPIRSR